MEKSNNDVVLRDIDDVSKKIKDDEFIKFDKGIVVFIKKDAKIVCHLCIHQVIDMYKYPCSECKRNPRLKHLKDLFMEDNTSD